MNKPVYITHTRHIVKMRETMGKSVISLPTSFSDTIKALWQEKGFGLLKIAFVSSGIQPPLGEYVSRNHRRREIRLPAIYGNGLVRFIYKAFTRIKTRLSAELIRIEMKKHPEAVALVFNGYLMPDSLTKAVADDIGQKKIILEKGFFPDTVQCDPEGINYDSSLPREQAFYRSIASQISGPLPNELVVRKSKLKGDSSGDLPDNYIFVPMQVPSDMQILAHSPWITSMVHLYETIARLAEELPSQHFVIKEHPSFGISIQDKIKQHPRIHFANHKETRRLIERSDAVITINSTVGMESLLLGKKVIVLGEAPYGIEGLVLFAHNDAELRDATQKLEHWTPDSDLLDLFLRYVYNIFLIPGDPLEPDEPLLEALDARVLETDLHSRLVAAYRKAPRAQ